MSKIILRSQRFYNSIFLFDLTENLTSGSIRAQKRFGLPAERKLYICVLTLVPRAVKALGHAEELLSHGQETVANVDAMMKDLTGVTKDLDALVGDVDTLVVENTENLTETIQKINDLDFDSLNHSIQDLSDVLEPLAKFFNLFPHSN